jgi:hypothetical protein
MPSGDSELEHWKNLIKSKKERKLRDRGGYRKTKRGFGGRRDFPQVIVKFGCWEKMFLRSIEHTAGIT